MIRPHVAVCGRVIVGAGPTRHAADRDAELWSDGPWDLVPATPSLVAAVLRDDMPGWRMVDGVARLASDPVTTLPATRGNVRAMLAMMRLVKGQEGGLPEETARRARAFFEERHAVMGTNSVKG